MSAVYDVIVIGLGGIGSATVAQLARRGVRVLGLDQFAVAHDRGSSHGETRIIRKAYFEHPDYVPLLHRAYDLWHDLEHATGYSLCTRTGLILTGLKSVAGVLEAAQRHQLPVESLNLSEASCRFPLFGFSDECDPAAPSDPAVVFEAEAGFLRVEECVRAHCEVAQRYGASLHWGEPVQDWREGPDGVEVITATQRYMAETLIVTAGAWASRLLPDLGINLVVRRMVQLWHAIESTDWCAAPCFFFEEPGQGEFYGFPSLDGRSIKIAEHTGGEAVSDPLHVDRECWNRDVTRTNNFVRRRLRHVVPGPVRHAVCLYTMSPDGHFLLGSHPGSSRVLLAAGFSGHGFKFAPVMGEALADLAQQGTTSLPIDFLSLDRPGLRRDETHEF